MRVGVLALQGGFDAHCSVLERLGHEAILVRDAAMLRDGGLDGLVLPGGESTTQLKLLARAGMDAALDAFVASGRPVLATCAGLILAARQVSGAADQRSFGWLDVSVARNGWGRQLHSFGDVATGRGPWEGLAAEMLFIRAPRIVELGDGVEVVAELGSGEAIAVRGLGDRANVVGLTGHPELLAEGALHAEIFGAPATG